MLDLVSCAMGARSSELWECHTATAARSSTYAVTSQKSSRDKAATAAAGPYACSSGSVGA